MSAGSSSVAHPVERVTRMGVVFSGEVIILSLRPHPLFVLLSSARDVIVLLLSGWLLWWMAGMGWMPFAPGRALSLFSSLALLRVGWSGLDWSMRLYVLTDRRVVRIVGVLRRFTFEAPLASIQHVNLTKSVPERVLGLGTIGFATAGTGAVEAYWLSIGKPDETLRIVRETLDKYGKR